MTIGKGKLPRDPNQLANWIVDRSTDEAPEVPAAPIPVEKETDPVVHSGAEPECLLLP